VLTGLFGVFVLAHLWLAYRHDWLAAQIRGVEVEDSEQRAAFSEQCQQLLGGVGFLLRLTGRDCAGEAVEPAAEQSDSGAESD
jgi:hypothetical protein